jgi:hypothetical protein
MRRTPRSIQPDDPSLTNRSPGRRAATVDYRIPKRSNRMMMTPGTPSIQRIPPFNTIASRLG